MEEVEQIMKNLILILLTAAVLNAASKQTFTGVITDTMCGASHAMMKAKVDADCVKACIKPGGKWRYALADGKRVYTLSDQQTPGKFAGRHVVVTGEFFPKTGILRVDSIQPR